MVYVVATIYNDDHILHKEQENAYMCGDDVIIELGWQACLTQRIYI